jgi:hypothetical protein
MKLKFQIESYHIFPRDENVILLPILKDSYHHVTFSQVLSWLALTLTFETIQKTLSPLNTIRSFMKVKLIFKLLNHVKLDNL